MGDKRHKLAKGLGDIIAVSMNFSDLEDLEAQGSRENYHPGDNGLEQERVMNNMMYEELVVQILCNLEPREKLIFMYQLLRDGGYQIDHAAFAKTLQLSRRQYMRVLDDVRFKTMLFVKGYSQEK